MDFSQWSPSHTIFVLFITLGFVGQIGILFYRTSKLEKHQDKTDNKIDNLRNEIRNEIRDVRGEINDVRTELSKLNQNHIDHLTHHDRTPRADDS